MILDSSLELCLAQAVTATAMSTNVIDIASARNIGAGGRDDLFLYIRVGAAVTASGAATVNFQLQTDTTAGLGSAVTILDSGAIPKASLGANTVLKFKMPTASYKEFIGLNFLVTTGPLTAGDFSAEICMDIPDYAQYPSGFTIM